MWHNFQIGRTGILKHKALVGTPVHMTSWCSNFRIMWAIKPRETQEVTSTYFLRVQILFSPGVHQKFSTIHGPHICAFLVHIKILTLFSQNSPSNVILHTNRIYHAKNKPNLTKLRVNQLTRQPKKFFTADFGQFGPI